MPTPNELMEQRANVFAQAEDFLARSERGDELSAEDLASWDRANKRAEELRAQAENADRTAKLKESFESIDEAAQRSAADSARTPEERDSAKAHNDAFASYLRNGESGLSAEDRSVLVAQTRAQGTTSGSVGGYAVPEGFWAKVTETRKFYAQVAELAEVITTDSGASLPWPTNNDTSNTGRLLTENTQVTETALSFGQATLDAYTFSSDLVLVSLQLAQDAGIDLPSFVARKAGERLGRIENSYFTTGSGTSEPQGFVTGATTGKTTASGTAIIYNELIDLVHSVDVAYREGGAATFVMNDLILAYVRKIRDDSGGSGLGRPIWEPSIQVGVPDSLLGYPVRVNNFMASTVATTNKTIAFGDFRAALALRRVNGGQLMTLRERYADYLQIGYFAFERADSVVQDSSAVKLLVQA